MLTRNLSYALTLTLSAFLLTAGCHSTNVREAPQAIRVGEYGTTCATAPLVAALLKQRGTSTVAVEGEWNGEKFAAECVTKGEEGAYTAILLSSQLRLATITLTPPTTITYERLKMVPETFEPEYAIFDLACLTLPAPALQAALGKDFKVREFMRGRLVQAAGRPVVRITFLSDGAKLLENFTMGYAYRVREVKPE